MKQFAVKSTALLVAAGLGFGAASAWSAESLQDVMKRQPQPAGPAGRGQDLRSDRQARRVRGVQLRRPVWPDHRVWHSVHAHPEISRRVHSRNPGRATAMTKTQGRPQPGSHRRQGHHLGRHAPPGHFRDQGKYDGQFLFINDKGQSPPGGDRPARFRDQSRSSSTDLQVRARRRLRDAEYRLRHRSGSVPAPWKTRSSIPRGVQRKYRGGVTYWKFDRKEGRIDPKQSFSSSCRRILRICRMPAKGPLTVGPSPTPSAPSATSAASKGTSARTRPVARQGHRLSARDQLEEGRRTGCRRQAVKTINGHGFCRWTSP